MTDQRYYLVGHGMHSEYVAVLALELGGRTFSYLEAESYCFGWGLPASILRRLR